VEIVLLKGAGVNGIDCKGIPQDQFGWIPKLNAWLGWIRERATLVMPWMSLMN